MYKLTITELAHTDLDEIISYMMMELAAPQTASDFADAVASCYDRIRQNPMSCELSRNQHLRNEGFRRTVIKNYIMLYKVFPKRKEVVVYRFFYGRRDYVNLI